MTEEIRERADAIIADALNTYRARFPKAATSDQQTAASTQRRPRSRREQVAGDSRDERPLVVLGVSTWNRKRYLERFVESFVATRSNRFRWILVIADDGSIDGTLDYARTLDIPDTTIIVLENKARTVAGQTNAIIRVAEAVGFDFAFKADDDVFFEAPGWDELYYDQALESGFDHLVYHNADWKRPIHDITVGGLRSSVNVQESLGCFYTLTPKVIAAIGYMDEVELEVRGDAHIDYTMRCCRAGFNEEPQLWDADGSQALIDMWGKDEYESLVDWDSEPVRKLLAPEERARRAEVIAEDGRGFVYLRSGDPTIERSKFHIRPELEEIEIRLVEDGLTRMVEGTSRLFDGTYVLNLEPDLEKWATTAAMLTKHGLLFERFPAVDGNATDIAEEWRRYHATGLILEIERQINRKLIQSAGAWGYLKTMEALIEDAKRRRFERILVFDDDVMLHLDFDKRFHQLWDQLPEHWKIFYLGHSQVDPSVIEPYSDGLYHPRGEANGSFAFGMHASVFDRVLSSIQRFDRPFDAGALREVDHAFPNAVFAPYEPLIIADVTTSAIRKPRDMEAYAAEMGWRDVGVFETRSAKDGPAVSILMIAHNAEGTLLDALSSLRYQTYPWLEILVANNGSGDQTSRVIEAARARDTRVRHFVVDDPIPSVALINKLAGVATGDWLIVHDDDEVSLPRRVESAIAAVRVDDVTARIPTSKATLPQSGLQSSPTATRWYTEQEAPPTLRGSLIARDAFVTAGGMRDLSEDGVEELLDRLHLDEPERLVPTAGSATLALVSGEGAGAVSDRDQFHQEIRQGQRSARVAATPPIALTEIR